MVGPLNPLLRQASRRDGWSSSLLGRREPSQGEGEDPGTRVTISILIYVCILCLAGDTFAKPQQAGSASPQKSPAAVPSVTPVPTPSTLATDYIASLAVQNTEFKKLLLEESKQHLDFLNRRVEQAVQWISTGLQVAGLLIGLAVALATVISYKNISDFKKSIRAKTESDTQELTGKILKESRLFVETETTREVGRIRESVARDFEEIANRAALADRLSQRRGQKYADTLKQVLDELLKVHPSLILKTFGLSTDDLPSLAKKRALWVDDDPVSVVLVLAMLERLGMHVSTVPSTRAAIEFDFATMDLVITNMNRDPIHDDGIRLARAIRNDLRCDVPIVLFTRPERIKNYAKEIEELKIDAATDLHEFFLTISRKCGVGESCAS